MARRFLLVSSALAFLGNVEPAGPSTVPPHRTQSAAAMPDDVRRMHERLLAVRTGDAPLGGLRIELIDGGSLSHRSVELEAGVLSVKEWSSPGSPMAQTVGEVEDARVIRLLDELVEKRYWTFEGTRFTPDAPTFLFRFYYKDLAPVDFRCDAEEIRASRPRREIRDLFMRLVAETDMTPLPRQPE